MMLTRLCGAVRRLGLVLVLAIAGVQGCATGGGGGGDGGGADDNQNEAVDNDNQAVENDNEAVENDNAGEDNANQAPANENEGDDVEPSEGEILVRFTTADFSGSGNCAACHDGLIDEADNDVSIPGDWRATLLANATRDPLFAANVQTEVDHAGEPLREVIEDTCAVCHAPMARTQAIANDVPTLLLNEGFYDPDNELHEPAIDGVSCTVCHQVQEEGFGEEDSFSGGYAIDTSTEPPDRVVFGPYEDPQSPGLMRTSVGYDPQFGDHIRQSELCATCHTLFTPTLDAAGNIVGLFPEQTPYLEWLASSLGDGAGGDDRACQSCHLPLADGAVAVSTVPTSIEPREHFRRHQFLGGNVFMLRLLRANVDRLGLTASTDDFAEAIELAQEFLQTQTAQLDIPSAEIDGDTLAATVRVENLAGHKFPTGFPSRRAWLHIRLTDGAGEVIFESGRPEGDGRIAGSDADQDPATADPHYEVIDAQDQVQIYQSIMENTDGQITYVLLRAAEYRKDNRLLPAGFDKSAVDEQIAVAGTAADDEDFIGGSDEIEYRMPLADAEGPFTVSAELLFESVSYPFAQAVIEDGTPLAETFGDLYQAADKSPALVASAELMVE